MKEDKIVRFAVSSFYVPHTSPSISSSITFEQLKKGPRNVTFLYKFFTKDE